MASSHGFIPWLKPEWSDKCDLTIDSTEKLPIRSDSVLSIAAPVEGILRPVHPAVEDMRWSWSMDAGYHFSLSRLHEVRVRIDELELTIAEAAAILGGYR